MPLCVSFQVSCGRISTKWTLSLFRAFAGEERRTSHLSGSWRTAEADHWCVQWNCRVHQRRFQCRCCPSTSHSIQRNTSARMTRLAAVLNIVFGFDKASVLLSLFDQEDSATTGTKQSRSRTRVASCHCGLWPLLRLQPGRILFRLMRHFTILGSSTKDKS